MTTISAQSTAAAKTSLSVLGAASLCHLLNDLMQAALPAAYPILQGNFGLSFGQFGLLTLVYQITASLFQPFIGHYTDKRPLPYSLPIGMIASLAGMLTLAYAPSFEMLLLGGVLLGLGSSIFHPEASRIARLASGGAHSLAQSLFQVGGNIGSALGPLAVAFVVLPQGQRGLAWFALSATAAIVILTGLGRWYQRNGHAKRRAAGAPVRHASLSRAQVGVAMSVLIALLFSKYIYLASFTSYYTFYVIAKFRVPIQDAQHKLQRCLTTLNEESPRCSSKARRWS